MSIFSPLLYKEAVQATSTKNRHCRTGTNQHTASQHMQLRVLNALLAVSEDATFEQLRSLLSSSEKSFHALNLSLRFRRAHSADDVVNSLACASCQVYLVEESLLNFSQIDEMELAAETAGLPPILILQSVLGSSPLRERLRVPDLFEFLPFLELQSIDAVRILRAGLQYGGTPNGFRRIIEGFADALVVTSLGGVVEYVNPRFGDLTGYSPEEVIGRRSLSFLLDERDTRTGIHDDLACDVSEGDFLLFRKDGGRRWVELRCSLLRGNDGRPVAEVKALSDITKRKELEFQFFHSQKMEAVGRLAGGVAHDFNNLLTAVLGYSGLLLSRANMDDPSRAEVLQIRKASEQASRLVQQLLTFSRKQVMEQKVVRLNAIVEDTVKMLNRLIGEDIELITLLDGEMEAIKADPGQIQQILLNLAINARDAMPQGGTLTIQTGNYIASGFMPDELPGIAAGSYETLAVSDTGCGMTEEVKSRIFEPFFTTKEQGRGTGLGLSTVYGIVKQSGGYISVHSELGRGSSFRIFLPRVRETGLRIEVQPLSERMQGGSETILLVEDEESVRRLLVEVLATHGYTVLQAAHGLEALQIGESFEKSIDLLITDVVMPHVGGAAVAQRLCAVRPEMKLLVMSGYIDDIMLPREIADNTIAFLSKPFTPFDFMRRVRSVLDSTPPPPPPPPATPLISMRPLHSRRARQRAERGG